MTYGANARQFYAPLTTHFRKTEELFDKAFRDMLTNPTGFPYYNIAKEGENKYVIELAIAGFGKENISIELEDNILRISGNITRDESEDDKYLVRNIATRAFTRTFKLNDTVEVKNAHIVNGILKVVLEEIVKARNLTQIPVSDGQPSTDTKEVLVEETSKKSK